MVDKHFILEIHILNSLKRKADIELMSPTQLPPVIESSNVEATTMARAASTADGIMSTTGLVTMPVPATEACPPCLASPFIHMSTPPLSASAKPIVPPSRKSRFPVDFFSMRRYNQAACDGEGRMIHPLPCTSCKVGGGSVSKHTKRGKNPPAFEAGRGCHCHHCHHWCRCPLLSFFVFPCCPVLPWCHCPIVGVGGR